MFEKLTSLFPKKAVSSVQDSLNGVNPIENLSVSDREKHDLGSYASSAATYLTLAALLIVPLFFLPLLADAFDLPRQALFFALIILAAAAYTIHLMTVEQPTVVRSGFDRPLVLFIVAATASALFSVNRFAALATDPLLYLTAAILFLLLPQLINHESRLFLSAKLLLASGAVLGLWSAIQLAYPLLGNRLAVAAVLVPYLNVNFSPTGSVLSQAIFLAALLPLAAGLFYQIVKKKESPIIPGVLLLLILTGLLVSLSTLFNNRPTILPAETGWKIATGTIGQSLTSAFLGTGPAHFVDAFTAYKSADFNNTSLWNLRFLASSNFYFYLLTTTGITGLAIFIWLVVEITRTAKKRWETHLISPLEKGLIASLVLVLILFAILPAPQVVILAFTTILALWVASLHLSGNAKFVFRDSSLLGSNASPGKTVLAIIVLVTLLAGGYFLGRIILADYHFARSLQAAAANRGTETYNEQITALELNPWNETYRVAYSQTNLALANTLASQPNLSDQQKQTVLALVQQSIREGRNAVSLSPRRASDWENLSIVYRNLINFAQGADQFAIVSLNQAINFDPGNPRLRLDLGGIYFSLKDFQSATQAFAQAANLKPDYANAHYNLAQALKELKLNDQALQQLQLTATLVCTNAPASPAGGQSADCQKVNAEITALGGTQTASGSATTESETPLATASAKTNLPKAKTVPPAKVSSPSGDLTPQ